MYAVSPDLIALAVSTSEAIHVLGSPMAQSEALQRTIRSCDVFMGVVPDDEGGHIILIKGKRLLEELSANKESRALLQGAIALDCDEEALALRIAFGDGDDDSDQRALH